MNSFFNCGVYRWTNTANGKSYVGSSAYIRRRKNEHLRKLAKGVHENPKLQNAWNKYGPDVFDFEMLAFCPDNDLLRQEQLAINAFDAVRNGYNISLVAGAPMRGRKASLETRKKLSKAGKGRKKPEGFGKKIGEVLQGRTRSEAVRAMFSAMRRGKPATAAQLRALAVGRVKLLLPEVRAKIGTASHQLWQRPERRMKLEARTKASFDQASAKYLLSPNRCEICDGIIMPLPHQRDKKFVTRLRLRKHCSRACANHSRNGEKHGPMPLAQRQAISKAKKEKAASAAA